jgi:hypothetical protein
MTAKDGLFSAISDLISGIAGYSRQRAADILDLRRCTSYSRSGDL